MWGAVVNGAESRSKRNERVNSKGSGTQWYGKQE